MTMTELQWKRLLATPVIYPPGYHENIEKQLKKSAEEIFSEIALEPSEDEDEKTDETAEPGDDTEE